MKRHSSLALFSTSKHAILSLTLTLSLTTSFGQWGTSGVPTHTTTSNVGIGVGPVFDARFRLLTNSDENALLPGSSSFDIVPGIVIQRDFYTNGMFGGQPKNIMEVWRQQYTGPGGVTAFTPGPNQLKFVIDGDGQTGINKLPTVALDVADDANVDKTLTIGNAVGASSPDVLTVNGNITFTRPTDNLNRNIRARTSDAAMILFANSTGENGPSMSLNGITNTSSGTPGAIAFSSVGSGAAPAYDFNNYDPDPSGPGWSTSMRITADGKVAVGSITMPIPDGYKLFVKDGILTERVKVALSTDALNWADFVFNDEYKLRSLQEVENYIAKHKHLPEIPSTNEVQKDGLDLAQMDAKLLQKIEELTLYVIQQQKEIETLKRRIKR